jgi:hypothetical protein
MDAYQRWDISLKGIALFGAGVFFAYQVLAGSYEVATSLSLAAAPMKCEGKVCALVTTKLERGANWSAYVEKAELTVVEDGKRHNPISIQYKHPSRDTFELAPGEKTEYGTIVPDLPSGKPVIIEALFVLQQKAWFGSYTYYVFASIAVPSSDHEVK